jgi:hypothetical protein
MMFKKCSFTIILFAAYPLILHAADNQAPVMTPQGELKIHHGETFQVKQTDEVCAVTIGGEIAFIDKCSAEYPPTVIGRFKKTLPNKEDSMIVVIQRQPGGNACNGGPLIVIESSKNYTTTSSPLDFCGGADPVITSNAKGVLITFPGGAPNRGSGYIPTEKYQYQGGSITKLR